MKVLIVGLNSLECSTYSSWLESAGHRAVCITEQTSAYNLISQEEITFDICLCNTEVENFDGFYLKRKLNTESNRLPVIFIAEKLMKDSELILQGLAAIRFINKPVSKAELLSVIDKSALFMRHIRLKPEFLTPIAKLKMAVDGQTIEPDFLMSRSYTLGRSDQSDIRIFNPSCSREQAIIQRIYDDSSGYVSRYSIVDYSRNGITVNGVKVRGFKELANGDFIRFPGFEAEYFLLSYAEREDLKATLT